MSTPVEMLTEDGIQRFGAMVVSFWTTQQRPYSDGVVSQLHRCASLDEKRRVINDCLVSARYESVRELVGGSWENTREVPEWEMWKSAVESWRTREGI